MARLAEISEYKTKIISKLIEDKDLCKALYYHESNFLDQPDVEDPYSLIYSNIFPYRTVPELADEAKTYINISFDRWKYTNNEFKSGEIIIYVITHLGIMKTDYGTPRVDYIVHKVDEILNETRDLGLGRLKFEQMGETYVNTKIVGQYLVYKAYEFN